MTATSSQPAILITGAARRIGKALALHLAGLGHDIALHYHTSEKEAQEVRAQVERLGVRCELFQANLAETGQLEPLIAGALQKFPHCRVLINNASIFERATLMESDEALYERQFAVNFKAPVFLTQAFARAVRGGSVINLLDSNIVKTHGSHFLYLLSKKALADFTRMAARELGPKIRVNAVCLGGVLPADPADEEYLAGLREKLPLARLPATEGVARAAAWLIGAPDITGQFIFLDSGQHLL